MQKWAFTSYDNEWATSGLPYTTETLPETIEYVCGQPEYNTTDTHGRPYTGAEGQERRQHFQGFAILSQACDAKSLKSVLGISSAHASSIGSIDVSRAIDYTKKAASAVLDSNGESMWREAGEVSNEMKRPRERTEALREMVLGGQASLKDIVNFDFKTSLHCLSNLDRMRVMCADKPHRPEIQVYFIQGQPGTGKSRIVWHLEGEDLYKKENINRGAVDTWDGYTDQAAVLFDDIDEEAYGIHRILNYLDRYPLNLNIKYSSTAARFVRVYITSNRPIDQFFPTVPRTDETNHFGAFLRRVPVQNRVVAIKLPADEDFINIKTFAEYKRYQEAAAEEVRAARTPAAAPRTATELALMRDLMALHQKYRALQLEKQTPM